jgi:protein-L-isoaspartate(D-aspartate) O-methyltransferase
MPRSGTRAVRMSAAALRFLAMLLLALPANVAWAQDGRAAERRQMIDEIVVDARRTASETGRPAIAEPVIAAMAKVPRHRFVPREQERAAYENRPLPIGHGQTISQPYIVALMTDLLNLRPGHAVLEIGTGSGYQAAILAELAQTVCTIEIIEPLARQAGDRLRELGYGGVRTRIGDGYYGWEECGPFDAIVVTAAAGQVPPPLVRQLKPGGRMVIPVGAPFMAQHLMIVDKQPDGSVVTRQVLPVRFVPLTGRH